LPGAELPAAAPSPALVVVVMMMSFMPVVEIPGPRANNRSDSSPFAAARKCADHRASRRADPDALRSPHVLPMSVITRSRIAPRGAHSHIRRKDSQKQNETKNNGYQTVFHIDPTPR
jgi:hypothetical protein